VEAVYSVRVLVLGSTGFAGRWVAEKLRLLRPEASIDGASLCLGTDLRDRTQTLRLFDKVRPEHVINCAAYVGGIQYGYIHPAEIFSNNTLMILNVLEASVRSGVRRLVQPISNCAYPEKESLFREENFWDGPLHDSVMVYGMTRKMMCTGAWAYARQHGLDTVSLVLSNMYGPGDHFDEVRSHALGALVKKIVDARAEGKGQVTVWGTGRPVREWLYVADGAEAMVRALEIAPHGDIINVGTGRGISVKDLALLIKEIAGWEGEFLFDASKPDGAPHKTVDGSKGRKLLGWGPGTALRQGIENTIRHYAARRGNDRLPAQYDAHY
jgi:GDP-L-fucose synthase